MIKKGTLLKDIHKRYVMYQLLKAIKYLHSGNVIHRDQKVRHVFIIKPYPFLRIPSTVYVLEKERRNEIKLNYRHCICTFMVSHVNDFRSSYHCALLSQLFSVWFLISQVQVELFKLLDFVD